MFWARGILKAAAFVSLATAWLAFIDTPLLRAQQLPSDSQQPEVENSKYQFAGVINSNAVYVRSGPSENDYPTLKLDKGAEVTVVGLRFDWLKIVPPEGSFCYVAKAYVNRAGNGSIGQVSTTLNVRIGSSVNPLKTKVATKLEPGERVEIIGEQDEYFKIKPPQNVYLYVNKQFVDPVRQIKPEQPQPMVPTPPAETNSNPDQGSALPQAPKPELADTTATPIQTEPPAAPTTQQSAENTTASPAATQPTADAAAEFDKLESQYNNISQRPLDEQPVEDLLSGYQKLAASEGLPESMRRICDWKVNVLKTRAEAKQAFVSTKKDQEDMKSKQMALRAEQEELEQRVKANEVQFYTAVGTLRTSSLQQGQVTLYRLTDPANGRTVVYLRSDDPKLGQFIGSFIGVRGEVTSDSQLNLRVVNMSSYEIVSPAKVGQSVAAQIVPPSLLPGGTGTANASAGNE
jgi:uncharacterized protein YgiM (DUF1202 family)